MAASGGWQSMVPTPGPSPKLGGGVWADGPEAQPVYLLVGHITRDRFASPHPRERAGGTVLYAGVAAGRLGWRVHIVTAFGADHGLPAELSGADVCRVPSPETTTFAITEGPGGRALRLVSRATDISPDDVPDAWRSPAIVHLAPVAGEVPPEIGDRFPGSFVGATAQGWLREGGPWGPAPLKLRDEGPLGLGRLSALVVSAEDLRGRGLAHPRETARALAAAGPTVALTLGPKGCAVFADGTEQDVEAFPARQVDGTGAGDVFAAAFFIRLSVTGDPVSSARFASWAAARSIEGAGVSRIPDLVESSRFKVSGSKRETRNAKPETRNPE